MKKLAPEVLADLGLQPDAELTPVHKVSVPKRSVAQGLATAAPVAPTPNLSALLSGNWSFTDLELAPLHKHVPDVLVRYWDPDPRIVLLECKALQSKGLSGKHEWLEEGSSLALDSRESPAFVRLAGQLYDCVLSCEQGEVELLKPAPVRSVQQLADWRPAEPAEVPAPDIHVFLSHCAAESWLVTEATRLASASWSLSRLAAAGLVARLWSPPERQDVEKAMERLLAEQAGPAEAATQWFRVLGSRVQQEAESSASVEADALGERLPELQESVLEEPQAASQRCLQWLHERDNLECVLFLLQRTNAGEQLQERLAELDDLAQRHVSLWSLAEVTEDMRLQAVSWQEPDAWWGQLALA
jgi:hypothetical protein